MPDTVETHLRKLVRHRMKRGQRDAIARAAGHQNGTWVTNWLKGVQKHATVDELCAMLRELHVDIGRVLTSLTAESQRAAEDWEVFERLGQIPEEHRPAALHLIVSVVDRFAAPRSTQQPTPRPNQVARKAPGKRRA